MVPSGERKDGIIKIRKKNICVTFKKRTSYCLQWRKIFINFADKNFVSGVDDFLQKWYTIFKDLITFAEVIFMGEKERRELNNALASTRMEGFQVTDQTEQDCIRLLRGEVSVADLVREILNRPAKAV